MTMMYVLTGIIWLAAFLGIGYVWKLEREVLRKDENHENE